jgi:hypothetical protein
MVIHLQSGLICNEVGMRRFMDDVREFGSDDRN